MKMFTSVNAIEESVLVYVENHAVFVNKHKVYSLFVGGRSNYFIL